MKTLLFGLSHKTAPIEIREQFCLTTTEQDLLLSELKSDPSVSEAFIIATCNRTELYLHAINQHTFSAVAVVELIAQIKEENIERDLAKYFYTLEGEEVLHHLMRVTTGLNSLILGEKQILGQVKKAFERARMRGMLTRDFNILANLTVRAGKKAQTETNISFGGCSVSWAALTQAEKVLNSLSDKSVLIIGAGEMSKLAVGQISNRGFKNLYLMNRTTEHAENLASQFSATVAAFCDIKEILREVDLCL